MLEHPGLRCEWRPLPAVEPPSSTPSNRDSSERRLNAKQMVVACLGRLRRIAHGQSMVPLTVHGPPELLARVEDFEREGERATNAISSALIRLSKSPVEIRATEPFFNFGLRGIP